MREMFRCRRNLVILFNRLTYHVENTSHTQQQRYASQLFTRKPLLITTPSRLFTTTHAEEVNEKNNYIRSQNVQTIDTITVSNLNKFDRLRIKSPFNLNIQALSPKEYPLMNKAFITLYGDSTLGFTKAEWSKMFDIHVKYDAVEGVLNIINSLTEIGEAKLIKECAQTLECHLEVPFQSGISVECTTNNNVKIHNLETKDIFINAKKGECILNNLRANSIIVHSDSGNIECLNTLHGNLDLSTNKCGSITTQKLLGSFIKLSTENNHITSNALYAENFNIKAKKANISLKTAKGKGIIDLENGKISVESMDGQLNAQNDTGDVKVFFCTMDNGSTIKTLNGDVSLSFLENLNTNVQLVSKKISGHVDVLAKLTSKKQDDGLLNTTGTLITNTEANTNLTVNAPKGKIRIDVIDWFSTLKFK